MSIPLSGRLSAVPLPDILDFLRKQRSTGVLNVRGPDGAVKCVYLKDGEFTFATSSDPRDRIGETLVRAGMLSQENLDRALLLYNKTLGIKKLGAVLVENGFISPQELFGGLKLQVKDIIYGMFLWREGDYGFEARLPPDAIRLRFDFQELLAEVIQRIKKQG
jgi:hypothetical protein